MRHIGRLLLIGIAGLACNLTVTPPTLTPSATPNPTDPPALIATVTLTTRAATPTLLPLPGLPEPSVSVTSVPALGAVCDVYTTYSGARADNKLSLRAEPSAEALQLFRIPNNVEVLRVPDSPEIEAEGYHWLNVIYEDASQTRYQGWIARDSYEVGGVRDPDIATLRPVGTERSC